MAVQPGVQVQDFPAITIHYLDSRGRETERVVLPYRFCGGAMFARCHLRNATRSFLVPRISQVICMATGAAYEGLLPYLRDTLTDGDLAALLPHVDGTVTERPHTGGRRAAQPQKISMGDFVDWLIAGTSVLYWLADSDGEIAGEEALMIEDFLFGVADRSGLDLDAGTMLDVSSRALGIVMERHDMAEALAHLVPGPQDLRDAFWAAAGRVVSADGQQRPEEFAAWQDMQDAWESLT